MEKGNWQGRQDKIGVALQGKGRAPEKGEIPQSRRGEPNRKWGRVEGNRGEVFRDLKGQRMTHTLKGNSV